MDKFKYIFDASYCSNNPQYFDYNTEQQVIFVTKRNGNKQLYNPNKIKRVCLWAAEEKEFYAKEMVESLYIKLYDGISIVDLFEELIKTAVNKINVISPFYEKIAARLLLLKIYRQTFDIKNNVYPDYMHVVTQAIELNLYSKLIFYKYSASDIEKIHQMIDQSLDYNYTYKALYLFFEKYCLGLGNKKIELPQHAYMRVCMSLFQDEHPNQRLELIQKFYRIVSNHYVTLATPIMLNAGMNKQQLSSCVLSKMADDTNNIMDTANNLAVYSKYKGGTAVDISDLRSQGSKIVGNNGFSSGPVPFVKIIESVMKGFNQGSSRPGACCVYFSWWHLNVRELVVLKNNGGTEENRARYLKYAIKLNRIFLQRVVNNETVTLFDPAEVRDLVGKYGDEFDALYLQYENEPKLKKVRLNARDLFALFLKERVETGNIYFFHEENVNYASLLNRYVNSSNLCCEIVLPSTAAMLKNQVIIYDAKKNVANQIIKTYTPGEIALCNLASVNLRSWLYLSKSEKETLVNILVRGMDNGIELAYYPVKEAEISNKKYRYLGIGVLNYANFLACKKIVIDSDAALIATCEVFDELTYLIINASVELAKEKGSFVGFEDSHWAKGQLPLNRANSKALALIPTIDWKKWRKLADKVKKYGIRNAQLMAIAPTATSGKAINATESIEPIQMFFYKEDGKINLPTLVPNIENRQYYKQAFECNQYQLLKLAAVRQCYLDQAQSINVYFKKITSATAFMLLHLFGFALGLKTFYYCKTLKDTVQETCESCA